MEKSYLPNISNFEFIDFEGTGYVTLQDSTLREVFVFGYFRFDHWLFLVHQDVENLENCMVSEASTGMRILYSSSEYVDVALRSAESMLKEKRFYLATRVNEHLVAMKRNLLKRNLTLNTLAMDTIWM